MIPDDWVRCKLDKLAKIKTGGTPRRMEPHYWDGDIPWMSSGEIHKRHINDTKEFITEDGLKSSNAFLLPQGTVMIALNGQGRTRGTVAILRTPVTCNQSLAGFIAHSDILNADYLFFYLDSKYQSLRDLSGDHGRNGLNLKLLREIEIDLPPLSEQKKIVAILSRVDDAIQATQALIDQTRRVKQGLLQQLLTRGIGHTRFKQTEIGEIPEEWETGFLNRFCEQICVGFVGTCEKYYRNTGIPMIRTGNLKEGFLDSSKMKYVTHDFHQKHKKSQLKPGDLLIARHGKHGQACLVPESFSEANCLNVVIVRVNKDHFNPLFLQYLFNSNLIRQSIESKSAGSTQTVINTSEIVRTLFPKPSLHEQIEIAEIIKTVDHSIDLDGDKLHSLYVIKRGLMQDLLTGRVRVKLDGDVAT